MEAINTGLGGNKEVLKKKYYHLIILVQNQAGLKNLYRIVSAAHTQYFFKKPRVPRSLLNQIPRGPAAFTCVRSRRAVPRRSGRQGP